MGVSKHGGIQTYRWASKHTGDIQTYGGIQTYKGPFKDIGASKHTGGIQTYEGCPPIYLKSNHHQILSRKVEMRFCSSSGQNIGQYIGHLAAGCSYQHTVQNPKEYFEKWIKYLKLKKKMAEIHNGRYS